MNLIQAIDAILKDDKLNCYYYGKHCEGPKSNAPIMLYPMKTWERNFWFDDDAKRTAAEIDGNGNICANGRLFFERRDKLTHEGEDQFVCGFNSVMPKTYSSDFDLQKDEPFCVPWAYCEPKEYISFGDTAEEMGRIWGARILCEYPDLFAEN